MDFMKNPAIKNNSNSDEIDLIGLHFLAGYFEFVVKRKHLDGEKYYCDGIGSNRLKRRVYEKKYIVENIIE